MFKNKFCRFTGTALLAATIMISTASAVSANDTTIDNWRYRPLVEWPAVPKAAIDTNAVTILGEAVIPQEQMVSYIRSVNDEPKINCTLEELVAAYYSEAAIEGVRGDIALCQALKETGFFRYGNDVKPNQNNYCGLGAVGHGAPGYSFLTPQRGVRAHIQHLLAYATQELPKQALVDPRYEILVTKYPDYHGTATYWPDLNGKWAVPGTHYGQDIITLWREAQKPDYEDSVLEAARQVARKNGQDYLEHETVAQLAKKQGGYEEALRDYDMVLKLKPAHLSARLSRGDIFREWGKDNLALKEYDQVLAVEPANSQALLGKAQILQFAGEIKAAQKCYTQVLKHDPDNTLALYNHGSLLALQHKYKAAMKDLARAQELLPDNKIIAEAYNMTEAQLKK